jgi:hypothetical protein
MSVVNIKKETYDVYIGRPSIFGNPYTLDKFGRTTCIELYKQYFLARVEVDPNFRKAVLDLRGKRLGCYCKPLACHGDIIEAWLEENET